MMQPLPSKPRNKSSTRRLAERVGHRGEWWAALFLRLQLYRIRDRRYKAPVGEIDLVVERCGTMVFVEVKSRGNAGSEAEALHAVNQRRIVQAAQYWLARHPEEAQRSFRFDVIFLAPWRWPRHVINAFDAS